MTRRRQLVARKGAAPAAKKHDLRKGLDPATGYPLQNGLLKSQLGKVVESALDEIKRDSKASAALRAVDAYLRTAD